MLLLRILGLLVFHSSFVSQLEEFFKKAVIQLGFRADKNQSFLVRQSSSCDKHVIVLKCVHSLSLLLWPDLKLQRFYLCMFLRKIAQNFHGLLS